MTGSLCAQNGGQSSERKALVDWTENAGGELKFFDALPFTVSDSKMTERLIVIYGPGKSWQILYAYLLIAEKS